MSAMLRDLRHGIRMLLSKPGFNRNRGEAYLLWESAQTRQCSAW